MKNFSFRRIKALMKYEITSDVRSLFYILGGFFAISLIITCVFSFKESENWILEATDDWFIFGNFMLTISLTARYLRPTQTKVYLTLPGNPLEKFTAHISIYFLTMITILVLRFGLVELSTLFYDSEVTAKDLFMAISTELFEEIKDVWTNNADNAYTFGYYAHAFDFMIFAIMGIVIRRLRGPLQKVIYWFCDFFLFFTVVGSGSLGLLRLFNCGEEIVHFLPLFIIFDVFLAWLLYRSIGKVQAK